MKVDVPVIIYHYIVIEMSDGQVEVGTLNHETCNVDLENAVEILIHGKCYGCCSLYGV